MSELQVYGMGVNTGGSSVAVTTEHLRERADSLRSGAATRTTTATGLARTALGALQQFDHLTATGPSAAAQAQGVVTEAVACAREIESLAAELEATATRYEVAEERALASVPDLDLPSAFPGLGPAGLGWLVGMTSAVGVAFGSAWRDGQTLPSGAGTGLLTHALARSVLPWSSDPVRDLAAALTAAAPQLTNTDVSVSQVDAPGTAPDAGGMPGTTTQPAVDGVAGAVEAIAGVTPFNGGPEGTVRVDRVVAEDGSVSWLVAVPGTQTGAGGLGAGLLTSGNVFTPASNVAAVVGAPTAASALVVQAMRRAGVRPGEPVVIAGHSQGGMVAMNAANEVRGEFDVAGVISVGAPVGHLDVPEGTAVLSLEHVEDGVHGADGGPASPMTSDRVTVSRDLTASSDPEAAAVRSWSDTHDPLMYANTGALVDASDDHAIRSFTDRVGPVLDGSATATSSYYEGYLHATVPLPLPVPGLPPNAGIPLPPHWDPAVATGPGLVIPPDDDS